MAKKPVTHQDAPAPETAASAVQTSSADPVAPSAPPEPPAPEAPAAAKKAEQGPAVRYAVNHNGTTYLAGEHLPAGLSETVLAHLKAAKAI